MKKTLVIALALVLSLIASVSVVRVRAAPAVLNVGPGQPFPLISAALTVALPGDSIHVWNNPGIPYVENPSVGIPNVQIIGQSVAGVTVQAAGPGPCFAILAPGVTIVNLQIVCPVIVGGTFGVYIFPSSMQCKILNNQILNFDYGVVIDNSPQNQIIGNDVSNCMATPGPPPMCSTGVYIFGPGATGNVVRGNELGRIAPNWYDVGTNGASGNTVTFNNFWVIVNFPPAYVRPGDLNTWDDGGLGKGNWWMGAPPPIVIDPNNFDKFCSPGPYNWAAMSWDINRDAKCDIRDVATAAAAFGALWSTPKWNPTADVILDGKIDIKDIAFIAKMFGWADP